MVGSPLPCRKETQFLISICCLRERKKVDQQLPKPLLSFNLKQMPLKLLSDSRSGTEWHIPEQKCSSVSGWTLFPILSAVIISLFALPKFCCIGLHFVFLFPSLNYHIAHKAHSIFLTDYRLLLSVVSTSSPSSMPCLLSIH